MGNSAYSNETHAVTHSAVVELRLHIGNAAYFVNGQRHEMDTTPLIREGRTLLPIRYVNIIFLWGRDFSKV